MSTENYRLYSLTNSYLSGIQKGIQTAHVVGEISEQYTSGECKSRKAFEIWAGCDKTIIVLDGGNQKMLYDFYLWIRKNINESKHFFPHAIFHEDHQSLNGAYTALGIIVPEKIWNTSSKFRLDKFQKELQTRLSLMKLAV